MGLSAIGSVPSYNGPTVPSELQGIPSISSGGGISSLNLQSLLNGKTANIPNVWLLAGGGLHSRLFLLL